MSFPYTEGFKYRKRKAITYPKGYVPYEQRKRSKSYGRTKKRNMRTAGYLGIEVKFLDVQGTSVAIPAPNDCSGGEMQPEGGCTNCLSAPAQGDGEQNRDGRKVRMKSLFLAGQIEFTGVSDEVDPPARPTVYLALVLDKQTNGATITSEQVFTNPCGSSVGNSKPLRNLEYTSRYEVLQSKTLVTDLVMSQADGANTASYRAGGIPFTLSTSKEIPMTFTSTTADVANVADNSLHLIAFSTSITMAPLVTFNSRMRFVG